MNQSGERSISILKEPDNNTRVLLKELNEIRPDIAKNIAVSACYAGASANCINELTAGSILVSRGPKHQFTFQDTNISAISAKFTLKKKGRSTDHFNTILYKRFSSDMHLFSEALRWAHQEL